MLRKLRFTGLSDFTLFIVSYVTYTVPSIPASGYRTAAACELFYTVEDTGHGIRLTLHPLRVQIIQEQDAFRVPYQKYSLPL